MKNLLAFLILLMIPFIGISQDPSDPFMRHSMIVDDGNSAPVDAKTRLCNDFISFSSNVNVFKNLNENSKVEQYKNVQLLVDQSWNTLSQSSTKMPDINIQEIMDGYEIIKEFVASINSADDVTNMSPKIDLVVDQTRSAIEKVSSASCQKK
jgi:hypothetical protein